MLVHNYNAFPVSASIIYAIDGRGQPTKTDTFEARSNKSICSFSSSARVYAKVTFTIKDYYTGKTETVTASQANYTIGKLTARGSP